MTISLKDIENSLKKLDETLADPEVSFAVGKHAETLKRVLEEKRDAILEQEKLEKEPKPMPRKKGWL